MPDPHTYVTENGNVAQHEAVQSERFSKTEKRSEEPYSARVTCPRRVRTRTKRLNRAFYSAPRTYAAAVTCRSGHHVDSDRGRQLYRTQS
jgi:hypothetical protein